MQVDDCERSTLEDLAIPENGRFVNRRRSLGERVYRFLERVRFVVPVTREKAQGEPEGKSIRTMSEFSR
ncbi:MAG TPA: hypothetical protein VGH97_00945 [Thermoanaerobaculia bacterium]|jgi:hypothetical protein